MLEINAAFGQEAQNLGLVGRTGENASRRIVFDCEAVLGEFPVAGIVCALRRACDAEAYAKELTAEGKKRLLTLSAADVAAPGSLMIELRAVEADAIRKSAVYVGRIERGLSGQGDAPGNPVADAINSLEARAKAASAAASAAQAVADEVQAKLEAGEFKGDPGKDGAPGKDGSDAEVTAENIQSALGYAPVTPSALAEKQDALTDADRQSITTTGMTTGPAWTAAQQAAARERMGAAEAFEVGDGLKMDGEVLGVKPEGVYELIETITIEEEVSIISADTTGYVKVKLRLEVPSDGNDNPGFFTVNSNAMAYSAKMKEKNRTNQFSIEYVNRNGMVFLCSYGGGGVGESTLMYPGHVIPYPRAVIGNTVDAINSIGVRMLNGGFYPVGTNIKIWGVRADA